MTVGNNTPFNQYTATNGQTTFAYNFEIIADSDLNVYQRASGSDPDDTADLLTLTTDYTVTGAGTDNGGNVVLNSGATTGDIITIKQAIPVERTSDFTASGTLTAANLNDDFDNQMLEAQRLDFDINNRMLKYPDSAVLNTRDLVLPVLGDNQIWQMDTGVGEIQAVTFDASTSASALKSLLASHDPGEGASLVGLEDQGSVSDQTVQDLAEADFIVQSNTAALVNAVDLSAESTGFFHVTNSTGAVTTRTIDGTPNEISALNSDGSGGNPTLGLADNLEMPGNEGFTPPSGTTAQRPGTPNAGETRWNSDNTELELFDGSSWIALPASDLAISGTGFVAKIGSSTFAARTFQDTTNQLVWTNADGVSGNASVALANPLTTPGPTTIGGALTVQGNIDAGANRADVSNLRLDGNTLSSTDANGNVIINPNGSGSVDLDSDVVLVGQDIQHKGDTNNKITFGTDNQTFFTGGSDRLDINDSGVQLGGAGARVTQIFDEDDMASNSASALATQQSIRAFVEDQIDVFHVKASCRVATTANLNATYNNGSSGIGATLTNAGTQAAFSSDGVTLSVDERVLVQNQTAPEENGLYKVTDTGSGSTNWVLTRTIDYDEPGDIGPGDFVIVNEGNTFADHSFLQQNNVNTIGTDSINFTEHGIFEVFDDKSPRLGANLDVNGFDITSPDGTDKIDIVNGAIDVQTNNASRLDVTDTGVRFGGANTRIDRILDADDGGNDSTAGVTENFVRTIAAASGAGKIVQIKRASRSGDFETSSTSFVDVTNVSVDITPSSTSNDIFVIVNSNVRIDTTSTADHEGSFKVLRDSTTIGSSGAFINTGSNGDLSRNKFCNSIIDQPASTATLTYKLQTAVNNSNATIGWVLITEIIVMEISGGLD